MIEPCLMIPLARGHETADDVMIAYIIERGDLFSRVLKTRIGSGWNKPENAYSIIADEVSKALPLQDGESLTIRADGSWELVRTAVAS